MLIMTLAYAQRAGDSSYLKQHYPILDQWTQYLIEEALIPANQISTDDFAGPLANQTNLALKGIIGIEAMATIANLTGNMDTAANYSSIAHNYISEWQTLGELLPLSVMNNLTCVHPFECTSAFAVSPETLTVFNDIHNSKCAQALPWTQTHHIRPSPTG